MLSTDQNIAPDKPNIQVAHNSCYELQYNSAKNRVYLVIKGFWKSVEAVPNFLDDLKNTLVLTTHNFTILTNLQKMITHPQELNSLHEEAHTLVIQAGVLNVAHVVPEDRIAKLQTYSIQEATGLPVNNFLTAQEAEEWLDQLSISNN